MALEENIKVVIRLRPFIPEIKEEFDGKLKKVIRVDELSSSIVITNPENRLDIQKFAFDKVLWSFDGYAEQADGYLAPNNKTVSEELYCDQKQVYEEVAKEMIQNLWNGYNCTIFTYGESKSGKSWTLLGLRANKGIVPLSLTDIFKGIREKEKSSQQNGSSPEVRISMSEVYNGKVKDLLPAPQSTSNSSRQKNYAKIREHSRKGFYIEGLRSVPTVSHEDVQQRLDEGLVNRAVFLTSINGTAENSMTIISITLVQKIRNHRGDEVTRTSTMEFIDLPACQCRCVCHEKDNDDNYLSNSSSLTKNGMDSLSKCIDSIFQESVGKQSDSMSFNRHPVTKLVRNAVIGNSKTCMIVTLSPSESSYQKSLFALKFAEKLQMMSSRPLINEEITSKLIRELKGENEKLKRQISMGEFEPTEFSNRVDELALASPSKIDSIKRKIVEDVKGQIRDNEKEIRGLQMPLEEKLKQFKLEKNDAGKKIEIDRKNKCHLYNLHSDSQVSGRIIHIILPGTVDFGFFANGATKGKDNFLSFSGPGIRELHGTFSYNVKDGKFSIKPTGPNCKILVNETLIQFSTILGNNDRIVLGGNQIWVFQNPKEVWLEKYAFTYKMNYEYVKDEISLKTEDYKNMTRSGLLPDCIKQQLLYLIPALEEARSIADDLNQNFVLYPVLQHSIETIVGESYLSTDHFNGKDTSYSDILTDENADEKDSNPQILVKVHNFVDGTFYYWSTDKFYERLETLKASYMQYSDDGDAPLKELEAFKESYDAEVPIGYTIIHLKPLAYLMNLENCTAAILDYISFQSIGSMKYSLCLTDNSTGKLLNDLEMFVESPEELLDQTMTLTMTIQDLQTITYQFKDIYCKYKFLEDNEEVTKFLDGKSSNFITGLGNKYERKICVGPITDNILNIILTNCLTLRFYGKQRTHKLLNLIENLQNEIPFYDRKCFTNPIESDRITTQLKMKEKSEMRQKRRLTALKTLMEQSELLGEESVPISFMRTLFEAKDQKFVNQSLEEHKELLTPIPEEPVEKQLPPELKALKRFSEICCIC